MPERIDARPALTLIGAALLLVSLFLDWYVVPAVPPATADTPVGNAWAVFESLDIIMAGIAIVAIYVAYEGITASDRIGEGWLLPLGLLAVVIVASQILDPPPSVGAAATDPATGIWLALGGAGVMLVGGILSTARLSLALELDSSSQGATTTRRRATAQDA